MEITINREIGKLGLPRHLVLGMDPGIASCGFALIDTANHEILDLGVRLFDSPTHPKTGQSLAVIRRGFRSTRRNIDRTQARLKHCLQILKAYGLIPQDATKEYSTPQKATSSRSSFALMVLTACSTIASGR